MQANAHRFLLLDALRGVAALAVVSGHLGDAWGHPISQFYILAVDFFFILSGFVIAYAYKSKLAGAMTAPAFWRIRVIRLYPLLVVGALIGAVAMFVLHGDEPDVPAWKIAASAGLAALALPTALFATAMAFPINGPAWSLFFELLANFVYAPVSRFLTHNRLIVLTGVAALLLVIDTLNRGTIESGWSKHELLGGVFRVFFGFTCGLMLYEFRPSWKLKSVYGWALMAVLGFILLGPFAFKPLEQLTVSLVVMPAIVWIGSAIEMAGAGVEIVTFLGILSYPIYILHKPVLETSVSVLHKLDPTGALIPLWVPLQFAFFIAMAWLAFKVIDEPVRKWLTGRFKGPPKPAPAVVAAE
ncbi:MAG TPA: acyltransferase [Hyphomonadaceae bacterium]|jgi:peptidoglycan/LPS O-acetylase OafA/YrhL|nr:acyltransferase [Hyphomonadaceae bacterium]